jgi:sulfonate transport system substrate-binding protein
MKLSRTIPLALAALLALGAAGRAEPVKIRAAWITAPSSLVPILFPKEGIARHVGQSYVVEPMRFQGSTPMITALAAGDLDIAEVSFSSLGYAIQNARMDDLRIIADEFQDAVDGYYASEFMVLKDGPVKTIEDLKGKVLATNVVGAGLDIGMRAMLLRHGLIEKRDYTIIEASYANMRALLAERKADLVPATVAFAQDPEFRAVGRPLFTQRDAMGKTQLLSWGARAGFIEKNRAALVDFLEDALRSLRWYHDPANRAQAIEVITNFTKRPPEAFEGWLLNEKDEYRDPMMLPDLDALQKNVDLQRELGFLKVRVDVKAHADLSLVQEAGKRLQ